MRALQLRPDQEWPEVTDAPNPKPGPGEVVLRVRAAGICRTDLHLIHNFRHELDHPVILGHEIAGEVVAGGEDLGNLRAGQLVVAHHKLVCGKCRQCMRGRETLCENASVLGIDRDGGFAEYVTTQTTRVLSLPATVSPAAGAALTCGGVTAYHALRTIAQVAPSDIVLVLGTGGVGLFAVQVAKSAGAEVIAADVRPRALQRAVALGARQSIEVDPQNPRHLTEQLGSNAVDIVLDLVGNPECVNALASTVRLGGRYIVTSGRTEDKVAIDPFSLFRKELSFVGARGSSLAELKDVLQLAAEGRLDSNVTVEAPLSRGPELLRRVDGGEVIGRAVIVS